MPLTLYWRDGNWHFRGTVGPTGKRRRLRGSCKTANKDLAARQIAEIEAGYWKGHFDGPAAVLTFSHACRLYRAAGKADSFLDAVEAHLNHTLVKDISEGTIHMMAKDTIPELQRRQPQPRSDRPGTGRHQPCGQAQAVLPDQGRALQGR